MAHITLDTDQLKDFFSEDHPMRALSEQVLNRILDAEMTEHLGALALRAHQRAASPR